MSKTTLIKNASWVIGWEKDKNGKDAGHRFFRNADVAFKDGTLIHVGPGYSGTADETIDGSRMMVMPGFISIHNHPTSEPGNKGLNEELGSPKLGQSGLYEYMPVFRIMPEAAPYTSRYAIHEMLKSGVTTYADLSGARENWVDEVAGTGIRGVLCPMYRSAAWSTKNGHSVVYDWDPEAGERGMERAIEIVEEADRHPSGRMSGMMGPSQIDTCTPELIQASHAEAKKRGIKMQIHAAQSVVEFNEMTQRHGLTPLEWLDSIGVLDESTIIGHCIFLNDHPWLHWPQADDFNLLVKSGTSVAHCPTVFWRRGIAMNNVGRYVKAGIPLGLGTDTFPHNFIHEMEVAMIVGRIMSGDFTNASTEEIFDAGTIGAAKTLGRTDIGRLEVGCKADMVLVDLDHAYMQPVRDPLRSLLYSAGDRAVKHVYVDGTQVVRDGEVITIDVAEAAAKMTEYQQVTMSSVRQRDWAQRPVEELSPLSYPDAAN